MGRLEDQKMEDKDGMVGWGNNRMIRMEKDGDDKGGDGWISSYGALDDWDEFLRNGWLEVR